MKRIVLSAACAGLLAAVAIAGPVRGQTPPPPPPPNGGTPLPGIQPPCPPSGCPTATPTITPTPTNTPTPTATATATPTNTPIPLFVRVSLGHKTVKVGKKQQIVVATLPLAHVVVQVKFPKGKGKHHGGHADNVGAFGWSFKQPGSRTTSKSRTATVTVTVNDATGAKLSAKKKYTIG